MSLCQGSLYSDRAADKFTSPDSSTVDRGALGLDKKDKSRMNTDVKVEAV